MKRRPFDLQNRVLDYRNDDLLLSALETEIKFATRFFVIVDFINVNIDPDAADPESEADKKLMATLGNAHWQRARKIIAQRRQLIEEFGRLPVDDESPNAPRTPNKSRS